jgi:hypothetical protein
MVGQSVTYVRGFQKGYRLAARTAGRTPVHLLLSWLVNLILTWTVAALVLWFALDIFSKNATGDPVTKVVLNRYAAWNMVYGRVKHREAFSAVNPTAGQKATKGQEIGLLK